MSFLHGFQGWSDPLLYGIAFFAVRATILLLAAWGVVRLLRNGSAASRHLVWTSALAGILVLPLLSASVPTIPLFTVRVSVDSPTQAAAPAPVAEERLPARADDPRPATAAPDRSDDAAETFAASSASSDMAAIAAGPASAAPPVSLTPIFAVAWGVIALLLLARLAVANARVAAWERAARPVQDLSWLALLGRLTRQYEIRRPVVLLESPDTDVPVTWGVVYPVILVPSEDSWDDEQRIAVLTHELAHVKRFDAFTQQLAQIALALLWFHPLVWLAVRRMRLEREHACDDFVLSSGARASRYADDLLGLARRLARPVAPAAAALAMARRSELEGRLLSILDPRVKRTAVRRARVGLLTLGVIALSMPLAAFGPGFDVVSADEARPALVEPREPREPMEPRATTPVVSPNPSPDASPRASVSLASPRLADLRSIEPRLLDARVPEPLTPIRAEKAERLIQSLRARPDTEPQRPVEVQTLIDVTKHLKRMTSDYDKGVLLRQVAKRYVRNDELRDAYLDVVASMTSDHERSQSLIALLDRDSLPATSTARVLRATALMTSDVNRAMVLKRITPATFSDTLVQRTYVEVLKTMTSSTERSAAIAALLKQPDLNQSHRLALLRATSGITSNTDKANVLMLFLDKQGLADSTVRSAFYKVAETLTSDYDYRRVMAAVLQ